jgi:hypothetical protein
MTAPIRLIAAGMLAGVWTAGFALAQGPAAPAPQAPNPALGAQGQPPPEAPTGARGRQGGCNLYMFVLN